MLKSSLALVATSLLATTLLFSAKDVSAYQTATVSNASLLNVRETPSSNAHIIAVLPKGTKVSVLNSSGSWDYIQYGSKKGYAYDKYLNYTTSPTPTPTTSTSTGVVKGASWLTVRKSASSNSQPIDWLKEGTAVSIVGKTGSWYQIRIGSNNGYVSANYVKLNTASPTPSPTPTPTNGTYIVKNGDTLYGIALTYHTTVTNLKALNGLASDIIFTGQTLKVTGTPSSPINQTLKGKTIVLDPGHAENRPGARGIGIEEENLTWDMATKVKTVLESKGAKVILTRTASTDCAGVNATYAMDLACRPHKAENIHANVFVSLHFNAGVSSANGTESFYYNSNDIALAKQVLNDYIKETGLHYRRTSYNNLSVLRNSPTVPSTLVELGFITNPDEASKFKNEAFKNKAANGIATGIENYLVK